MFTYPIEYIEDSQTQLRGELKLEDAPAVTAAGTPVYRTGQIALSSGQQLDLVFCHSDATASFIYLQRTRPNRHLFELLGLPGDLASDEEIWLPGQVILGAPANAAYRAGHPRHDALPRSG